MRFLVLGAGSQGSYFGGMLLQGGADVSFLVRPERAAELGERGLVIKLLEGEFRHSVKTLVSGRVDGRYDVVLLACKSYDLDSAIEAIAPALGETALFFRPERDRPHHPGRPVWSRSRHWRPDERCRAIARAK
jgi:2-dehydropantoate 2-reductase